MHFCIPGNVLKEARERFTVVHCAFKVCWIVLFVVILYNQGLIEAAANYLSAHPGKH